MTAVSKIERTKNRVLLFADGVDSNTPLFLTRLRGSVRRLLLQSNGFRVHLDSVHHVRFVAQIRSSRVDRLSLDLVGGEIEIAVVGKG